ncbi:MAG: hypothetical protein IKB59_00940 [Alphaproteobacteria bacterium]|nr:hypothetical protein [Alphaproteobacteria bacterium]
MQENKKPLLDKSSWVAIAVATAAFLTISCLYAIDVHEKHNKMIENAKKTQQQANHISKNVKTVNFFQKTK